MAKFPKKASAAPNVRAAALDLHAAECDTFRISFKIETISMLTAKDAPALSSWKTVWEENTMFRKYLVAAALTLAAMAPAAAQNPYESKRPVEVIAAFPPGGSATTFARILFEKVAQQTGMPFVMVSKPGANGRIAAEFVANAAPDGHTLLLLSAGLLLNQVTDKTIKYDVLNSFDPVAFTHNGAHVLYISPEKHPDIKTVQDLVAHIKANPGKILHGTAGVGSFTHFLALRMLQNVGGEAKPIPMQGAAELTTAILGQEIDFAFNSVTSTLGLIQDGQVRALAVTTKNRSDLLPDIPAFAETVMPPDYETSSWQGVVAPKGTPPAIIEYLNAAINEALQDPELIKTFREQGATPGGGSPEDFRTYMANDLKEWTAVADKARDQLVAN